MCPHTCNRIRDTIKSVKCTAWVTRAGLLYLSDSTGPGGFRTITDSERLLSETDIGHSAPNRLSVRRPYQPRHFLAVTQENQRRPQLDPERPPEAPAGTILHLQVVQIRVIIEGPLPMALGSLTMAAPLGTELQRRRALEGVQFLARGRAVRIMGEHGHVTSWVTGSGVLCVWTAPAQVGVMRGWYQE